MYVLRGRSFLTWGTKQQVGVTLADLLDSSCSFLGWCTGIPGGIEVSRSDWKVWAGISLFPLRGPLNKTVRTSSLVSVIRRHNIASHDARRPRLYLQQQPQSDTAIRYSDAAISDCITTPGPCQRNKTHEPSTLRSLSSLSSTYYSMVERLFDRNVEISSELFGIASSFLCVLSFVHQNISLT